VEIVLPVSGTYSWDIPALCKDIPGSGFSFMFIVVVVGRAHITHSGYSGQLGRWVPRRSPPSRRPRPLRR
jgi:hypothetical protein